MSPCGTLKPHKHPLHAPTAQECILYIHWVLPNGASAHIHECFLSAGGTKSIWGAKHSASRGFARTQRSKHAADPIETNTRKTSVSEDSPSEISEGKFTSAIPRRPCGDTRAHCRHQSWKLTEHGKHLVEHSVTVSDQERSVRNGPQQHTRGLTYLVSVLGAGYPKMSGSAPLRNPMHAGVSDDLNREAARARYGYRYSDELYRRVCDGVAVLCPIVPHPCCFCSSFCTVQTGLKVHLALTALPSLPIIVLYAGLVSCCQVK